MAKFNRKGTDHRVDPTVRVAGGLGAQAARQDDAALLRRAVMACLLWEDMAYESGAAGAANIASLVPLVDPRAVADIAIEARQKQKLRHVPLWIAVQMLKYPDHKKLVREVLAGTITRADQITDTLALYWKEGRRPVPRQLKLALADAFGRFNEYQFAKYDRDNEIKLRDALRICHAKPAHGREDLYGRINKRTLAVPDTWEVALSSGADKKAAWERLIAEGKLGNLAFLRNLRNMVAAGVDSRAIIEGLANISDAGLLPLNFFGAAKYAPQYAVEIEAAMFRAYGKREKVPGHTVFIVDVSGSMRARISSKSEFDRIDAAAAMAVLVREICERATIWATAGAYEHKTAQLPNVRGFGLAQSIRDAPNYLGGGGIFTRQCLEFVKSEMRGEVPDRIVVFSDSQDCDRGGSLPQPFGRNNYIVDVSSHSRGIGYAGVWTAEIAGWSEHFMDYVLAMEGQDLVENA